MPQNTPKKGNLAVWIILIVVVLIAVAAILYFGDFFNTNTNSNTNLTSNQNTNSSTMKVPVLVENRLAGLLSFTEKNNAFTINIPREVFIWEREEASEPMYVVLSSSEEYLSTFEADFWAKIIVLKDEIIGLSERDALIYEGGRDALPLINDEFLTINNLPAYRAFRQVKSGENLMGEGVANQTFTAIEYSFLKNGALYVLRSNITGDNQDFYISLVDRIAQTFK